MLVTERPDTETFGQEFLWYYLAIVKTNGYISFLLHIIVFYLLIFKTPKEMRTYRIYLMNTSIMSFLHDLHCTLIWRPVPIFPILGAYSDGWLSYFNGFISGHCGFIILTILIAFYLCSMISGFIYRIVSLMDRSIYNLLMTWQGLILTIMFHVVPAFVVAFLLHLSYVPVEDLKPQAIAVYPQLRPIFEQNPVFVYDFDLNPMLKYFCGLIVFLIVFALTTIEAFCIGFSIYQLRKAKKRLSTRAYKLHFNLCVALAIQMALPMFLIMYPIIILCIGALYNLKHLTVLAELSLIVCTMHSILDSLVIIFLIKPYRMAIIKFVSGNSKRIFQQSGPSSVALTTRTKNTNTFASTRRTSVVF